MRIIVAIVLWLSSTLFHGAGFAQTMTDMDVAVWQIALDQVNFSVAGIDGKVGPRTRATLIAWQQSRGLTPDGIVGPQTRQSLGMDAAFAERAFTNYTVTAADVTALGTAPAGWRERASVPAMAYETLLELVAEKFHASEEFIKFLNPDLDWSAAGSNTVVRVPQVKPRFPAPTAATVRVNISGKFISVFDKDERFAAYFPCSIGRNPATRPVGTLEVANIAPNPNYTFDPAVFSESPEAAGIGQKLIIPPGPNNPVGVMWIGLSKPGFGIHGTPKPADIGRTESHGCFRLANWDARRLAEMIMVGVPVIVEP
jgi:lipoprotein-anchoring transpeptidase ErfK/SrfK